MADHGGIAYIGVSVLFGAFASDQSSAMCHEWFSLNGFDTGQPRACRTARPERQQRKEQGHRVQERRRGPDPEQQDHRQEQPDLVGLKPGGQSGTARPSVGKPPGRPGFGPRHDHPGPNNGGNAERPFKTSSGASPWRSDSAIVRLDFARPGSPEASPARTIASAYGTP